MRYVYLWILPEKIAAEFVKREIDPEIKEIKANLLASQGIKLLYRKTQVGQNGLDFVYKKITVRVIFDGYRVPRIIKNRLKPLYAQQYQRERDKEILRLTAKNLRKTWNNLKS